MMDSGGISSGTERPSERIDMSDEPFEPSEPPGFIVQCAGLSGWRKLEMPLVGM